MGWRQYNLGVVYYKTGQLELAIKYYNSAIDRLPKEEEIIYNLWTMQQQRFHNNRTDSKIKSSLAITLLVILPVLCRNIKIFSR
ncbi:tetratricopeptide repeat protein [Rickettsia sp. 2024-CO-Wats]|uniref:tetratricopeptide repeat protein n=1 Tax=unclassified Rickettsia TaxID=114295 RepID=UPI00370D5255